MNLNSKREISFIKIIQKKNQKITIDEQAALLERNKYVNVLFEFTPEVCQKLLLLNKKLLQEEKRIFDLYKNIQKQCKELVSGKFIDDYEITISVKCWNDNYYKKFDPSIDGHPFFETGCNFMGFQETATYTELDFNDTILKATMPKMNHCYSFHHLYEHTYLTWFDLSNIDSFWIELIVNYQHFTTIK